VQATTTRPKITATADGAGVVSHAGSRLLADVADQTTLTGQLSQTLAGCGSRGRATIRVGCWSTRRSRSPMARQRSPTLRCWRIRPRCSARWRRTRHVGDCWTAWTPRGRARSLGLVPREVVWAQRAELSGEPFPSARAAGRDLPGLVIDLDASVVVCHSEKELAAPTFKKTFGFHPMLAFCDNTGEFLAAVLRRGNAGSNTAADHITVLDAALAQVPDRHRHGSPILVRADTAGCTREFLAHVRGLHDRAVSCEFSVGWAITAKERAAISAIPAWLWADAVDVEGGHRDGAGLAEITRVLAARVLVGYPSGIRVIVRRDARTPERSSTRSKKLMAGATPPSPPTPGLGNWPAWTPDTARTSASKTGFDARKTPAWATSRPDRSRSTKPGSTS
jgi:hypothetical protein